MHVYNTVYTCMLQSCCVSSLQFFYMAKGLDTMIRENSREEVTVSDGLQLGRSTVDNTDVRTAESEVNNLRRQVAEVSAARCGWHGNG